MGSIQNNKVESASRKDLLIVGQGLAGSVLALQAYNNGLTFDVLDENAPSNSTKVAAGLVNPITGRRYVKSWNVDTLIPYTKQFFKKAEQQFEDAFYHELPIRKILANDDIIDIFDKKMENEQMHKYALPALKKAPTTLKWPAKNVGSISGAFLDTIKFLEHMKQFLVSNNAFIEEHFDISSLDLENNSYNQKHYRYIVFCQGYKNLDNPFFGDLPINPCKGEVLVLDGKHSLDGVYQKNSFLLPLSLDRLKVGSNYEWEDLTEKPTEKTKSLLLDKMDQIVNYDHKIIDHKAGLRPTVKDRRPVLGKHHINNGLAIFNGLGTKGVSLAPFMANHLLEHLFEDAPLMPEVDINRFR